MYNLKIFNKYLKKTQSYNQISFNKNFCIVDIFNQLKMFLCQDLFVLNY